MRSSLPLAFVTSALVFACTSGGTPTTSSSSTSGGAAGGGGATATSSATGQGGAPDVTVKGPCKLPGSLQFIGSTTRLVPGGKAGHDLSFLKLPSGFCAHWFGNVGDARQLRFAPGGELFVASPTQPTTGGNFDAGRAAIMVLPDDDNDGYADKSITFLSGLGSTQGLLFTKDGHFYYQDHTKILSIPYAAGDRKPSGPSTTVVDVTIYVDGGHWPKTLDQADDGTIYVGNGGDQNEVCDPTHPFHGGILKIDGTPGGTPVAKGFRNPIAIRCAPGHNHCFALELALDFSGGDHGREKAVPIRDGDDWGYPCCATKDQPYTGVGPNPNCDVVTSDKTSFFIGDTPFGIAFQSTTAPWGGAWKDKAIIALHGAAGAWTGARVVAVDVDPDTGLLLAGTNIHDHKDQGSISNFAEGWDDGSLAHGRPAAVDFSSDGRLFIGNDNSGDIIWVAPLDF
jgi:glucose/arabinose dehydrogenase